MGGAARPDYTGVMPHFLRALLATALLAAPAWTWGPAGHHIVATMAWERLSPDVKARVTKLLLDGKFTMAQVSTCPDALRSNPKYPIRPEDQYCLEVAPANPDSGPWHYIDITVPTAEKGLDAYCPKGACVTAKIKDFRDVLRNSNDDAKRREALMYLIHFVGDMHQPLHCAERSCDQGGNQEHVNVTLKSGVQPGHTLHRAWDEDLVVKMMEDAGWVGDEAAVRALLAQIKPDRAAKWARATIDEIAWEGWEIAKSDVYKNIPKYNYCDPDVKANPTPASDLSASYEKEGEKVVHEQLMKAAVRLADLLEKTLTR
jgi:hypothetical protein